MVPKKELLKVEGLLFEIIMIKYKKSGARLKVLAVVDKIKKRYEMNDRILSLSLSLSEITSYLFFDFDKEVLKPLFCINKIIISKNI